MPNGASMSKTGFAAALSRCFLAAANSLANAIALSRSFLHSLASCAYASPDDGMPGAHMMPVKGSRFKRLPRASRDSMATQEGKMKMQVSLFRKLEKITQNAS
jgi:hypothetical protein